MTLRVLWGEGGLLWHSSHCDCDLSQSKLKWLLLLFTDVVLPDDLTLYVQLHDDLITIRSKSEPSSCSHSATPN